MAQTAAHLVECVIPWVPTRQWVVSVPIPLRYWTAPSKELTAKVHPIIRTTIAQYYVNQAVKSGIERQKVQPALVQTRRMRLGGYPWRKSHAAAERDDDRLADKSASICVKLLLRGQ